MTKIKQFKIIKNTKIESYSIEGKQLKLNLKLYIQQTIPIMKNIILSINNTSC